MAVYDINQISITDLAQSETLFNLCSVKKPDLTMKEFRQNLDTADRILKSYQEKESEKNNTAKEIPIHDGNACMDCGSINLSPTGNCKVCLQCGASQGCS